MALLSGVDLSQQLLNSGSFAEALRRLKQLQQLRDWQRNQAVAGLQNPMSQQLNTRIGGTGPLGGSPFFAIGADGAY